MEPCSLRELWGGACCAQLPQRLADISDFRPVPDNQEVWADAHNDQSMIFEIVEPADATDGPSLARHYFSDLSELCEAEQVHVEDVEQRDAATSVPGVSGLGSCHVLHGSMHVSKGRQGAHAQNEVDVLLAVLQLPAVHADILISLHTPKRISSASAAAEHAGSGYKQLHLSAPALLQSVLTSFCVKDFGLFG